MPNNIGQEIVQMYIVKNKRKRILWELDNPKKREYILFNRFLRIDSWKKECFQPVEYLTSKKLSRYLTEKSKKKEVYFIGEDYIGPLPIKDAVERTRGGSIHEERSYPRDAPMEALPNSICGKVAVGGKDNLLADSVGLNLARQIMERMGESLQIKDNKNVCFLF